MVTNLSDGGAGSLRQAVASANATPGADTVQFDPALSKNTLTLTTAQITVSDPLTIVSPGSRALLLSGNSARRIFVANADLTLIGFEIGYGAATAAPSAGFGGAILSTANLTIEDCTIAANSASHGGGAIYQTGGSLTIIDSTLGNNSAGNPAAGQGGAILASGTVTVRSGFFQQNFAKGSGAGGGAIALTSGSLLIENSGFQTNGAGFGNGGAIYAAGPVTAINCTFDNNGAGAGGGLYLTAGGTLWNCTVAFNGISGGGGKGGGIYGDVILESTIVSNNISGTGPDVFGAVTAKNCALGSSAGFSSYTDEGGNLAFGSNLQFRNTISGIYGGTQLCLPLYPNSPCKNKGSNPAGEAYDVRGFGYPRTAGTAPDIGSYEIQPPPRVTVSLNDGSAQRSGVIQLGLTYDRGYILPQSFILAELTRQSDGAAVTLQLGGAYPIAGAPWSFSGTYRFTGGPLNGSSLADGVYVVRVLANQIMDEIGQQLDGNGDGIGGDDYVSPLTGPGRIHRLFGDADGDGDVDAADFAAFRGAFGGGLSVAFDFDGDGDVDAADFGQFRARFGMSI
jgi:predicted outer membrane repeat protein